MAFTGHGHHIPNSPVFEKPDSLRFAARCGGFGLCEVCRDDTVRWHLEHGTLNVVPEHTPHELFQYFDFEHLPKDLRLVSRAFYALARDLDSLLEDGSQKDLALTHLLQAKDAAVRARLTDLNKKD